MPRNKTLARVRKTKAQGKALASEAGELVREEMHQIREGKRSTRRAIALALAKARRAGAEMPVVKKLRAVRRKALLEAAGGRKVARGRARTVRVGLKHEGKAGTTTIAVGRQVRVGAVRRGPKGRPLVKKAVRAKAIRRVAAKKIARTRRAQAR